MELDDLLVYYLWLTGIRGIGPVNQHTLLRDLLIYYLWLTGIRGIGPVNQHTLLRVFKTPEAVYHASEAELLAAGLAKKRAKFVLESRDLDSARQELEQCRKLGIFLMTNQDE